MFLIPFYLGYGRRKDMVEGRICIPTRRNDIFYHVSMHILSTGRYLHAFLKKCVSQMWNLGLCLV
jgi:hypothetical protein